jgi:hypothetical protein
MKFKDAINHLVKAKISIESLQTVGGFLIMETDRSEFALEFCKQTVHQVMAQNYTPVGDTDKDKIIDFEIPIGNICHVASVINEISKINLNAKSLMYDWKPFVEAAKLVVDDALAQSPPERGLGDLGPERMN